MCARIRPIPAPRVTARCGRAGEDCAVPSTRGTHRGGRRCGGAATCAPSTVVSPRSCFRRAYTRADARPPTRSRTPSCPHPRSLPDDACSFDPRTSTPRPRARSNARGAPTTSNRIISPPIHRGHRPRSKVVCRCAVARASSCAHAARARVSQRAFARLRHVRSRPMRRLTRWYSVVAAGATHASSPSRAADAIL